MSRPKYRDLNDGETIEKGDEYYDHYGKWLNVSMSIGEAYDEESHCLMRRKIAEAGTVATETGLTPRQLAEQRAELANALRDAFLLLNAVKNGMTYSGDGGQKYLQDHLNRFYSLIEPHLEKGAK